MEICKLLGVYNEKELYLYINPKTWPKLYYDKNYFFLPKWVEDPNTLSFLQAVKIIQYRIKNNIQHNSETKNVDKIIQEVKDK